MPKLLSPAALRSLVLAHRGQENVALRRTLERYPRIRHIVDAARPPLPYDREGRWRGQRIFENALPGGAGQRPLVLDLGAGEGRDDQLSGLSDGLRATLVRSDIYYSSTTDFIADAHRIPAVDHSFDGVILQGVVEHVTRPWEIAAEITRVLKPGGVVFCEAPFIQWYHEDPGDYYRFTEDGLKQLFSDCQTVASGVAIGPVSGAVGIVREILPLLFESPYVYWPLKWFLGWVTFPLVWLDRVYRGRKRAKTIALAVYLVARK